MRYNYYGLKGGSITMFQCIDVEINDEMADEIEKRAAALQMSPSRYIKLVLMVSLELSESVSSA